VVRLVLEQRQSGMLGQYLDALRPLRCLPEAHRDCTDMAHELLAEAAPDEAPFILPTTPGAAARTARLNLLSPDALVVGIDCCVVALLYQAMTLGERCVLGTVSRTRPATFTRTLILALFTLRPVCY
jgi:hypothetical protein